MLQVVEVVQGVDFGVEVVHDGREVSEDVEEVIRHNHVPRVGFLGVQYLGSGSLLTVSRIRECIQMRMLSMDLGTVIS